MLTHYFIIKLLIILEKRKLVKLFIQYSLKITY